MNAPQVHEPPEGTPGAEAADSGRLPLAPLFGGVLGLTALLVVVNFFPHWFGVLVAFEPGLDGWKFLPLLAPELPSRVPSLNAWWGAALVLGLVLLWQRRWHPVTRAAALAVDFLGIIALLLMLEVDEVIGLDPESLSHHGWPPDFQPAEGSLVDWIVSLTRVGVLIVVVVALIQLVIRALGRARRLFKTMRVRRFVREGMAGRTFSELLDIFREDASRAYAVLDRDGAHGPEPEDFLGRVAHRAKVLFGGVTGQLSPPRRLLFAASLLTALFLARNSVLLLAAIGGLFLVLLLELVDRVRVRDELEVAQQLQRDLLPTAAPEIEGYRIAHSYRTANEVGGDYYDFLPTEDGRLALVVGDASGHGIAAGLLMAIASATLKAALDLDPAPERVVATLHRALLRTADHRAFLTIFYGVLSPASGRLEYVCAGHPFPLLRRRDGEVEELGSGSLPVGIRATSRWSQAEVTLVPGDRLILFSDGLPEAVDGGGEAFSYERLLRLAEESGSPREIHDRILRAFDAHVADEPIVDDLTLVVVGRDPRPG
ncbi:MAG: PP2C family protein-serine/threonine phosphatase [bacterium]|nr:PP2C family protein-serine/threonine phosphatase [bacterium]